MSRKKKQVRHATAADVDRTMRTWVARAYFGVRSPEDVPAKLQELAEQPHPFFAMREKRKEGA